MRAGTSLAAIGMTKIRVGLARPEEAHMGEEKHQQPQTSTTEPGEPGRTPGSAEGERQSIEPPEERDDDERKS